MSCIKNIPDGITLVNHFLEFVKDKKSKPYTVKDWVGKDGREVDREKERALTFDGFRVWLWTNKITSNINEYAANKDGVYNEFVEAIDIIKTMIRADQLEGAMAGMYNGNIVSRIQNLADNTNVSSSISIMNIDPLDDGEEDVATK